MAATQEEKDLKNLFPGRSISKSARQISEDPDLYAMLVALYERNGRLGRVNRLLGEGRKGRITRQLGDKSKRPGYGEKGNRGNLRGILSSDKRARREFAVEARNFLSKRQAGQAVEKKRLELGRGRSASIIRAARGADTQTTALGRTGLGADPTSRVQAMLGQTGALG